MLHTLRNALPIVAAALGRKFGIEVGVGGHDACTDGKRIQIPDVPDDPASRDLAWGYLAHEAAHVRYTDFAVYELAAHEGPLQEMLQNRIEDVRIERELGRPYPGTRATITKVLHRMLTEGRMSAPQPSDQPAQVLAAYLLLALRHEVLNQRVMAEEAGKAADTLQQVFPSLFLARLRTLMDEVPGLTSTAEAVDLARRIRRLVEDEADPPSGNRSGETGDPNDEDEPDQTSGAAGSLDDDEPPANEKGGKPESNGQETGEDGVPDGVESASNEEQDGCPDGPESKPDNGSETESPDATDRDTDAAGASGADAGGNGPQNALAAVLAAGAGDCDDDLFTQVGKLLGTEASATNEVRLPLPEEYAGNALAGLRLLARVHAESARLSARLQGLVQASRMDRPRPVRSGRHLDTRRLHRVAVADARIFARKSHHIAPNTAVHLLVDLSGSMHATVHRRDGTQSTRAGSALESALALALALDGIPGVTVAATAFPGRAGTPDRLTRMVGHDQSPQACAGAFVQAPRGGTPMAQALWYAAADLLACREERRMLVVLTDGEPDDAAEVLRLLGLCRQAGIETVGVGICICVQHLFPAAIEVAEAKDLKRELFGVAERLLMGAAA
ncbi:MAG: VWA domain-containing protein [Gammaproteobacteria bacterium]